MDFSHLLLGGAAFGFITSCWGYIKTVLWKICNLFVQQIEIHDENTSYAVVGHLIKNYRKSKMYDKAYAGNTEYIRDSDRNGLVAYEIFGKRSMIFWNWCFPFIFQGPEKKAPPANGGSGYGSTDKKEVHGYITYIRGTLNVDKIISNAVYERNDMVWNAESEQKSRHRRFFIKHVPDISKDKDQSAQTSVSWWFHQAHIRLLGYKADQLGRGKNDGVSLLDNLIFPKRVKTLIEEIKLWRKNRKWYQERGIPWKRGWLLYGPPGTGKTALARAFAEDLDLPIFVFNLSEIGNFEFMRNWIAMQQSTPCIALIEDIDNVFHGRENVANNRGMWSLLAMKRENGKNKADGENKEEFSGGRLNFDVFLNCLDGVERSEGVFTIITTNDLSKVDPALGQPRKLENGTVEFISTRPGRIDKAIELTYMESPEKRIMANRILSDYPDALAEIMTYIDGNTSETKETPAQFQERCAQIALALFWREQHPELFAEESGAYILVDNEAAKEAEKKKKEMAA